MVNSLDRTLRIDSEALAAQIARVNVMLRSEGGSIELMGVTPEGVVQIRFHGMCGSCMSRPMTTNSTVRPMIMSIAGVAGVEDVGFRVSDEAQNTFRRAQRRAAEAAAAAARAMSGHE